MHTFTHGKTTFLHNGAFDGEVEIRRGEQSITLPFADVRALVAEYVRRSRIAVIEDAADSSLLGVRCDDEVPCPDCGNPVKPTNCRNSRGVEAYCSHCERTFSGLFGR